jgi:hypothetical protein
MRSTWSCRSLRLARMQITFAHELNGLGLLATWIAAQRALSVNPLILLREE